VFMDDPMSFDAARAFGGVDRLFGAGTQQRLAQAHVLVAGVGGVGSWAVEALARSGVGALTLVDPDHLAQSNLNRQLPALTSTLGQSKVHALAQRIALINPHCAVRAVDEPLTEDNLAALIGAPLHGVLDCIDQPRVKTALTVFVREQRRSLPLVLCGAAGGKRDPTQLRVVDLAQATHDPLLARVRNDLRRNHRFARVGKMGVRCVSSPEPRAGASASTQAGAALACAGYGSTVTLTAPMGFAAAAALLAMMGV
jgi:tRNA threonylcarbamoyladenosine dehydratase